MSFVVQDYDSVLLEDEKPSGGTSTFQITLQKTIPLKLQKGLIAWDLVTLQEAVRSYEDGS